MGANPKDSKWYAAPETLRRRPHINLTLPREVIARLDVLAHRYGSRSAAVERLVMAAKIIGRSHRATMPEEATMNGDTPSEETIKAYINGAQQFLQSHLTEWVSQVSGLAKLVIVARCAHGGDAKFEVARRDELLAYWKKWENPKATTLAGQLMQAVGENLVPCVFQVDLGGGREVFLVRSVVYVPQGMGPGGDA